MKIKLVTCNPDLAIKTSVALKKNPEKTEDGQYMFELTPKKFANIVNNCLVNPVLETLTEKEMTFFAQ